KLVLDGFQDDQELRELFFKEARLASSLAHPNIINVTDFGLDDELGYFVVMDLLEGETLRDRMRQKRPTLRFIFDVLDQVAGAVRYIHARDIIHCDLKPENLFLSKIEGEPRRSNEIKLLDFGLSWRRETMPDPKLGGTPPYLAPERLRGAPPSPLCDVYSLGMVLYELIAGQLPYSGTVPQLIEQQLTGPVPPPPSTLAIEPLDERADALVMRALSRNPAHRHASAEAFQFELRAVISMMGLKPSRRSGSSAQVPAPPASQQIRAVKLDARPSVQEAIPTPATLTSAEQMRLVHLVAESPVPLGMFDLEGRVKLANRSFVETLEGIDIPIATFNELAITQRHPEVQAMFQRALEGHAPASRVVLAGAEGDERSTILWVAPFFEDGVVAGVHITVTPSSGA
ncbi:MAG: protein kinase, partial [Polyangia bacterium]